MLDGTEPGLLLEWAQYFQTEPFGEDRADLRNAILCLFIADTVGAKKQGGGRFKLEDFMPDFNKQKQQFNPESFKQLMKSRYGNNSKSSGKSDSPDR